MSYFYTNRSFTLRRRIMNTNGNQLSCNPNFKIDDIIIRFYLNISEYIPLSLNMQLEFEEIKKKKIPYFYDSLDSIIIGYRIINEQTKKIIELPVITYTDVKLRMNLKYKIIPQIKILKNKYKKNIGVILENLIRKNPQYSKGFDDYKLLILKYIY